MKRKKNEYMKMIYTATMYNNKYFLSKDLKVADSQGKKLTGKLSSTISRSGGSGAGHSCPFNHKSCKNLCKRYGFWCGKCFGSKCWCFR